MAARKLIIDRTRYTLLEDYEPMGWDDWNRSLAEAIGMNCDDDGDYGLSRPRERFLIKAALK